MSTPRRAPYLEHGMAILFNPQNQPVKQELFIPILLIEKSTDRETKHLA